MGEAITKSELLWRQYNTMVDLFKYYLDLALKANTWFYGIAGAIVTYYLSNRSVDNYHYMRFALLLPLLFSMGLGVIFWLGAQQAREFEAMFIKIAKAFGAEGLEMVGLPHIRVLVTFAKLSSLLYGLVCIGLFYLLVMPPGQPGIPPK